MMVDDEQEYIYIRQFHRTRKEINHLEDAINYYIKVGKDVDELVSKLSVLQSQHNEVVGKLETLIPSPTTIRRYKNLCGQLEVIVAKLKIGQYGAKIDRNQGLSLENYIYGLILRDIEGVFTYEFIGRSISSFRYSFDSDFDHLPIKILLGKLIDEVKQNTTPPINYVQLDIIHQDIKKRILEVAIEEYNKNRKT